MTNENTHIPACLMIHIHLRDRMKVNSSLPSSFRFVIVVDQSPFVAIKNKPTFSPNLNYINIKSITYGTMG